MLNWLDRAEEESLHLSVLTLGEIRQGIVGLPHGKRRARLEAWLETGLRGRFEGRIIPVTDAVADRWGRLMAQSRSKGRPAPFLDTLLAATAIEHHLAVVTRNARDFARLDVPVVNPWEA